MAKAEPKKEEIKTNNETTSTSLPIRRQNDGGTNPFTMMRLLAEDMENMMSDFGFGRRFGSPLFRNDLFRPALSVFDETPFFAESGNLFNQWSPQVEMFERDGNFVIQADLPGIKKDDVKVEITDHQLTVEGERKDEREEKGEGFFRSERTYGSFFRQIPLPEGVDTKKAKAEFKNGVLEISMDAPKLADGKRRLEISDGDSKKESAAK